MPSSALRSACNSERNLPIFLKTDSMDWLEIAKDAIFNKQIVALAYERLFGLAADATSPEAVAKVAAIKERDPESEGPRPIAVILPNASAVEMVAESISPEAERLADRFWPGPLTLIVCARPSLPRPLVSPTGGIGVRAAGPSPAAMLAAACGLPLTATSANRAGETDSLRHTDMAGIDGIDIIVEGAVDGPPGSTVVDVMGRTPRVLRQGVIDIEEA